MHTFVNPPSASSLKSAADSPCAERQVHALVEILAGLAIMPAHLVGDDGAQKAPRSSVWNARSSSDSRLVRNPWPVPSLRVGELLCGAAAFARGDDLGDPSGAGAGVSRRAPTPWQSRAEAVDAASTETPKPPWTCTAMGRRSWASSAMKTKAAAVRSRGAPRVRLSRPGSAAHQIAATSAIAILANGLEMPWSRGDRNAEGRIGSWRTRQRNLKGGATRAAAVEQGPFIKCAIITR